MTAHDLYMQRCLELAANGLGHTLSNPMVGCVVVYENNIVAEGFHRVYGGPHAEVEALSGITDRQLLSDCTVYVSLEPCSHHGKTPPCADLLIAKGVKKVVMASRDPNPLVAGKGIEKLRAAGIEVTEGILDAENRELNRRFFTFHEKKRPYIILKWAQNEQQLIAPVQHQGQFRLTGEKSNRLVHQWRAIEMSILVGRKTIEQDNPRLNVRLAEGKNPLRLILDPYGQITGFKNVMNDDASTIFFTRHINKAEKNVKHVAIPDENFLDGIMAYLHRSGIVSVFVEGGAFTLGRFITQQLWDEARIFTAPVPIQKGLPAPDIKGKIISRTSIDRDLLTLLRPL